MSGSVPDKCRKIMELGCSIMRDQADDFIDLVLALTRQSKREGLTVFDCLDAERSKIPHLVIDSGAKGEMMNFKLFLEGLSKPDKDGFLKRAQVDSFDKNVRNGKKMGDQGKVQFIYLTATNGMVFENDCVLVNGVPIFEGMSKSLQFVNMFYNPTAVSYVVDKINELGFVHLT